MVTEIKKSPDIFKDYVDAAQNNLYKLKCEESELPYIVEKIPSDLVGSVLSVVAEDYDPA